MDYKIRYTLDVKESLPKEEIKEFGELAIEEYKHINQTVYADYRTQRSGSTVYIVSTMLATTNTALIMTYEEFQTYKDGGRIYASYSC